MFLISNSINATNYYVSNNGDDNNLGTSIGSPFETIQKAANGLMAGDTVFVENGNYAGFDYRGTSGTVDQPIVFLATGQNVNITSNGPLRQDGINIEGPDYIEVNGFIVNDMVNGGNGIRVVLSNHCIVRNCQCDNNDERGIFTGFTDDILIEYNICTNSVDEHGIYVSNSSDRPIIRYNQCYGNNNIGIHMNGDVSAGGDGIISDAKVYGNIIHDNNQAAGINMDGVENPIVYNNLIYNNHNAQGIAMFQIDGAIPTRGAKIYNNTIIVPTDGRWGILVKNGSNVNTEIYNNIIINQHSWRGCITVEDTTSFKSDYNVLQDKMSNIGDGDTINLASWQSLGFDLNSLLADPEASIFADYLNNDFHLKTNSQAIDTGTELVFPFLFDDLDMSVRPQGMGFDIGCYEFNALTTDVDVFINTSSIQLYPNPTTGYFKIKGVLENYTVNILDQNGAVHQSLTTNNTYLSIDLSNLPSGLYFVEIQNIFKMPLVLQQIIKM